MSERGGQGASGARPLAVSARTIIEGSFDAAGHAPLDTVYDVGLALDVPEQTIRLALRRMQAAGELVQVGRGRAGRIERSPDALRRTKHEAAMLDFAFAQDAGSHPWDGLWHLYAFSVPERARADRDALRSALLALGTAAVAPGMYVSPHDVGDDLATALPAGEAARWLVRATTHDLALPDCSSPADIAERLWPSGPTIAAYEPLEQLLAEGPDGAGRAARADRLDAAYRPDNADRPDSTDRPDPTASDEVAVTARALRLSEGLERGLAADPLLPNELRTSPWAPQRIRAAFLREWLELERLHPGLPVFA